MARAIRKYSPGDIVSGVRLVSVATKGNWNMICECGQTFQARPCRMDASRHRSCGCRKSEGYSIRARKHGHYCGGVADRIASVWHSMRNRCYNPNYGAYPNYGAKGVTVCERWRNSIEAFAEDMGPRPPNTTLDRWPDNRGNYEPENCRWATAVEQARNKKTTLRTPGGQVLKEFAEQEGLSYQRLRAFYVRHGLPFDVAVAKTRAPRKNYKRRQDWG